MNKEIKNKIIDKSKEIITDVVKESINEGLGMEDTTNIMSNVVKGGVGNVSKATKRMVLSQIYPQLFLIIGIVVAVVIIGIFLWRNPFDWNLNFFGYDKIDKTENILEEVKKISEFTTTCFYQEMVIQDNKYVDRKLMNKLAKFTHLGEGNDSVRNEIVMLVKGKVRAGFNLQNISDENMKINSDSISIFVPKAEIFDVIINPSDYEVYVEEGKWTHEEISNLQIGAQEELKKRALEGDILDKANKFGLEKLKNLFKTFGFTYVDVKLGGN